MTSVKPILNALLDKEPLSVAEVREMLLRHVLSGHADPRNVRATETLVTLYKEVWMKEYDDVPRDLVEYNEANQLMKKHFREAYVEAFGGEHPNVLDYWVWPAALPKTSWLPREVCIVVAQAIGTQVGRDVKKYHKQLQPGKN